MHTNVFMAKCQGTSPCLEDIEEWGPFPIRLKREKPVREEKNNTNHPPRKLRGKPAYNKDPGCSTALSSAAPGFHPHVFWSRPGPSDWVSSALTFPEVCHRGLRQFVSTRPLGLAVGVRYGGLRPTALSSSPIGPTPKPTSPWANVARNVPRIVAFGNWRKIIFGGGKEKILSRRK